MKLSAGDRLGPYEIDSAIGKGGMGEVYKARDPRLQRDVAIKILAHQFTGRFEHEARAIAALNHPNICTLFDVGPDYLVMELVEGPTLAERIARGALPLEESLSIGRQIAEALEAAHEKGIVHRDLKPANVKVRPDGSLKVLDFGLAQKSEHTELSADSSTLTTATGMIAGTPSYMSPEQAAGQSVDKRADIWAFGVVLYEVLTGERLFPGSNSAQVLAAVMRAPVDLNKLPKETPRRVRELLSRCLDRNVRNRLRDIGEARVALQSRPEEPDSITPSANPTPVGWIGNGWIAAAVLALCLAGALVAWYRATARPALKPLVRLDVDLGADVALPALSSEQLGTMALSPDGTRLVYESGNPVKLFLRRFDQVKAKELPGTEGADCPFFSPDGQWVGFFADGTLSKVSIDGGGVVSLAETPHFAGAYWADDGSILVGARVKGAMLRIPPGGGTPEELATLSKGELAFGFPQLLPGGKSVLFTTYRSLEADGATIEVLTLKDRHRNKVLSGGIGARFLADRSPGGRLIYSNRANLFAVPFDLGKLAIAGTPVPLLDDIAYQTLPEIGIFTVSASGALIYRSSAGPISDMRTIQWLSPGGDSRAPAHPMEPLRTKQGAYVEDALSPDGQQIALSVAQRGGQDIWVYDLRQSVMKRLTHGGGFYQNPVWTPDGQYIMFSAIGQGILQIRADDPDQMHVLIQNQAITVPWCLTKDSSYLAYFISDGQKGQIWTVPLQRQDGWLKAGNPELFLNDHANDLDPSFSPDRHWIAYHSDQSGRREVYVRPFPRSSDQKWRISVSGGLRAHWSGNGHDLLYQLDDKIMAASYRSSDGNFNADTPRVWAPLQSGTWWDLSPDGSRALVLIPVETTAPKPEHEAVLLMNFSDELQRKVPLPK